MLAVLDATAAADPTVHWSGPWFPWFLIFPFFWILALGLFFFLGRRFWWGRCGHGAGAERFGPGRYPGPVPGGPAAAEEILRERYARGDIDEAEYRQRLEVLRGAEPGPYYQP
jgi:putative membrane protein